MTQPISSVPAQAQVASPAPASPSSAPTSPAGNIGPAVKLSLTNVAKGDGAKGDPDGDGH